MYVFFLKLLGVPAEQVAGISGGALRFRGDIAPQWLALAALVLGALVVLLYRRAAPDLSRWRRWLLTSLRVFFLILILALLLRPVWELIVQSTVRRELALLVDVSTSMKVEDPRSDASDLKRAALALGRLSPQNGLKQELASSAGLDRVRRIDLVKSALKNPQLDLLNQLARDYDLDAFTFESTLAQAPEGASRGAAENGAGPATSRPVAWVDNLQAGGQQTALGDALRNVLARKRGQPMAGVLLVTDGANNSGSDPRAAAQIARDARVPLFIYGVGIEKPRNLALGNIFAPEVSFVRDEVPVTVRLRSQGVSSARLTLKLVDASGNEQQVDQKALTFEADSEPAVSLKFAPTAKGQYTLKATVEPTDGSMELTKQDNEVSQALRVIDSRIKVLLVDQSPRWEFKYLMAMLLRDRRIEAKVVLVEGSKGLARGPDSPYLDQFPPDKQALLKYDLILLGDVDPSILTAPRLEAIEEFVTRFGGGLAAIAGKRNMPWSYRRTPLEKMLPVELDPGATISAGGADEVFDKPVRLELTAAGRLAPMLRLASDQRQSDLAWAKLPPVFWIAPVSRAKPAAEVLLIDPTPARGNRYGKMPVLAVQQYGMGQVLWLGTENTWRWRRNRGDEHYIALWGQIVQRLALPHLLGASKRTQLTLDKKEYNTNEKANLYARLYTEAYAPISQDKVLAYLSESGPDDPRPREITLRMLPDQPGMYRGEFNAPERPGDYKLHVALDRTTVIDVPVKEPQIEPGENSLARDTLDAMAKISGGAFFREEDLYQLPQRVRQEAPRIVSRIEVEFWTSPLYYLLMLAVVSSEWVLRKTVQLK